MKLGDRVRIYPAKPEEDWRAGVVRYVGNVQGKEGDWVGVELDAATGHNDGMVDG